MHTPDHIAGDIQWIRDRVGGKPFGIDLVLPASTVSKLELGTVTHAVHHLDELAMAYNHFGRQLRGEDAPQWEASFDFFSGSA